MFVKAIQIKDLKAGDEVQSLPGHSGWGKVQQDPYHQDPNDPYLVVKFQEGSSETLWIVVPEAWVYIRSRPWPEGKTEEDFAREFKELLYLNGVYTGSFQAAIRSEYRELLDAYELGKPVKQESTGE